LEVGLIGWLCLGGLLELVATNKKKLPSTWQKVGRLQGCFFALLGPAPFLPQGFPQLLELSFKPACFHAQLISGQAPSRVPSNQGMKGVACLLNDIAICL